MRMSVPSSVTVFSDGEHCVGHCPSTVSVNAFADVAACSEIAYVAVAAWAKMDTAKPSGKTANERRIHDGVTPTLISNVIGSLLEREVYRIMRALMRFRAA
jgi:hypothetical protein